MKVNSINSINYFTKAPAFKHTAVPYPEFENYVNKQQNSNLLDKLSELFHPTVTKNALDIKSKIDGVYSHSQKTSMSPKAHLLSVLA